MAHLLGLTLQRTRTQPVKGGLPAPRGPLAHPAHAPGWVVSGEDAAPRPVLPGDPLSGEDSWSRG